MNSHSVAAVFLLSISLAHSSDWPQWRGPSRNGHSRESVSVTWTADGPPMLWKGAVGTGFSGISVSDGLAYTMGNSNNVDTVWCLDARSGAIKWSHSYAAQLSPQWYEGGPGATPTIHEARVYTISKWGDVFCFDAKTGEILWQHDLRDDGIRPNRWGFAGSPLVWQNLVIFNAGSAGVAFERRNGRVAWSSGTNQTGYASPTLVKVGGKERVLIFAAQHLVEVDPANGAEQWRFPWKTDWDTNNSDPIVEHDRVFISSFSHGCAMIRLSKSGPEVLYENKAVFNNLSPGVVLGGRYYVFSGEAKRDTELRCVDLATGEVKWSAREPAFGSVLAAGSDLVVLSEKGELFVYPNSRLKSSHGAPAPAIRVKLLEGTCWTPPSLANGLLYLRNARGEVRCYSLGGARL